MISESVCDAIIAAVLADEGGVADAGDGEGVTYWGQTSDWLHDWGFPIPRTKDEAAANYREWMRKTRLDELTGYSAPMAHAVIDSAVNEGLSFAIRALQASVSVPQDGALGQVTLNSVAHADETRIAYKVLKARQDHYVRLAQNEPDKYLRYLGGWLTRLYGQILSVSGVTL